MDLLLRMFTEIESRGAARDGAVERDGLIGESDLIYASLTSDNESRWLLRFFLDNDMGFISMMAGSDGHIGITDVRDMAAFLITECARFQNN